MEKYSLKTFVPAGKYFHLHRAEIGRTKLDVGHRHGYAEVFWVEKGSMQHIRNGVTEILHVGDVAWIRSGDSHAMRSIRPKTTIINLAFADSILTTLGRRYYSQSNTAPWEFPLNHSINHLEVQQVSAFGHFANQLAFAPQSRLSLENFLLELLQTISMNNSPGIILHDDCPGWLMRAINEFVQQQLWDASLKDFATIAGRSVEHVSRTIHKFSGKTTSELLNGYRIEKAAADLCMTNKPVVEIAMNTGFENLGYFYRLFKKHFKESPNRFRKAHQAMVLHAARNR